MPVSLGYGVWNILGATVFKSFDFEFVPPAADDPESIFPYVMIAQHIAYFREKLKIHCSNFKLYRF